MAKYKHQFKAKALLDKTFTAKNYMLWMPGCKDVNNVVNNRFHLLLPLSFTMTNGNKGNDGTSFQQKKDQETAGKVMDLKEEDRIRK
eukprot:5839227-Ditylum_brightwellii.AAC.1